MKIYISKRTKNVVEEAEAGFYITRRAAELSNNDVNFDEFLRGYFKDWNYLPFVTLFDMEGEERQDLLDKFQAYCFDIAAEEFENTFVEVGVSEI